VIAARAHPDGSSAMQSMNTISITVSCLQISADASLAMRIEKPIATSKEVIKKVAR
jgi:hypothetical protein